MAGDNTPALSISSKVLERAFDFRRHNTGAFTLGLCGPKRVYSNAITVMARDDLKFPRLVV